MPNDGPVQVAAAKCSLSLGGGSPAEGLAGTGVQSGDGGEVAWAVPGEVGSLREILAQQPVGVLVGGEERLTGPRWLRRRWMRRRIRKQRRFQSSVLSAIAPDGTPITLSSDADGNLRAGTHVVLCAVCAAPNPTWILPVGPVKLDGNPFMSHSNGDWTVCEACTPLVEARDIDEFVERSASEALRQVAVQGETTLTSRGGLHRERKAMRRDAQRNYTPVFATIKGPIYGAVKGSS